MSRNHLLVVGAVCWSVAGIDAIVHLINGDVLVPAVMASAFVAWVGLRRDHLSRVARPVPVEVDTAA